MDQAAADGGAAGDRWIGDVRTGPLPAVPSRPDGPSAAAIEPRDQAPPPNVVTIAAGATMAEMERPAIEMALRETRGNRRRAAEMLGIGERTLYRKIKEYRLPEQMFTSE